MLDSILFFLNTNDRYVSFLFYLSISNQFSRMTNNILFFFSVLFVYSCSLMQLTRLLPTGNYLYLVFSLLMNEWMNHMVHYYSICMYWSTNYYSFLFFSLSTLIASFQCCYYYLSDVIQHLQVPCCNSIFCPSIVRPISYFPRYY